jgi:hypothetical protein
MYVYGFLYRSRLYMAESEQKMSREKENHLASVYSNVDFKARSSHMTDIRLGVLLAAEIFFQIIGIYETGCLLMLNLETNWKVVQ